MTREHVKIAPARSVHGYVMGDRVEALARRAGP